MLSSSKQATDHANQALTNVTATRTSSSVTINGKSGTKLVGKHLCIESWHANDYSQWYRIYDDGWKECGGVDNNSGGYQAIALPLSFSNLNYAVVAGYSSSSYYVTVKAEAYSVSEIRLWNGRSNSATSGTATNNRWYCCGY